VLACAAVPYEYHQQLAAPSTSYTKYYLGTYLGMAGRLVPPAMSYRVDIKNTGYTYWETYSLRERNQAPRDLLAMPEDIPEQRRRRQNRESQRRYRGFPNVSLCVATTNTSSTEQARGTERRGQTWRA